MENLLKEVCPHDRITKCRSNDCVGPRCHKQAVMIRKDEILKRWLSELDLNLSHGLMEGYSREKMIEMIMANMEYTVNQLVEEKEEKEYENK